MNNPALKLPRCRFKSKSIIDDVFIKDVKAKINDETVDSKMIRSVIKSFNLKICDTIVKERDGIDLPEDLGVIFVASKKYHRKGMYSQDPTVYKKTGQNIDFTNLHTDGLIADIIYTNHHSNFTFASKGNWSYDACRILTRSVSSNFRENWSMYKNLSSTVANEKRELRAKIKEYIDNKTTKVQAEYDEFNLD